MVPRLKIFHKLLLGYAVFLVIAMFFGVYVYSNIKHIRVKQRLVEVSEDARDEVLEMRRNEKNFIIRRGSEYIKNIHAINKGLIESVENLEPEIKAAFGEEDYSSLRDSLESYQILVDKFSEDISDQTTLEERFRETGRSLETTAVRLNDPKTVRLVLETRLLEKNYLLFKDREYVERLRKNVEDLKAAAASAQLRAICGEYMAVATRLADAGTREEMLLARIQDTAKQLQGVVEKVANRERAEIDGYLVGSQRLLLAALFAIAAVGPLLMLFMARAITAPVIMLEEAARRISEGEEDLRVKVRGDQETASLQRSFNVMLNKLQTSRESLEHTIRLLQEKNAMLIESEKLASIGVLASGVAHEMNNPLANILLTAEALRDEAGTMPRGELDVMVKEIIEQTDRARNVVGDLLSYTRSMKDEKLEALDLNESVRRSVKLLAHHIGLHDTDLREAYAPGPVMVNANAGRLEQVFVNIMLNALHAMERGGTLALSVLADMEERQGVVEIRDTGPGIPPETIKKIFDPFFTTKATGQGTGLGLYISHGIVKDYGGEIDVDSRPGEGATFRVRLPLEEKANGKNGNDKSLHS